MDETMNCLFKTTRCEFLSTRIKLKDQTTGMRKNPEVIEERYDLHLFRSRRRETRCIIGASRSLQSRHRKAAEYDAFGKPYTGNFDNGIGNGYTGKPYDSATGLYNYGYRDYSPVVARFTTVDPIRDGSNWFSYVKNDPVNYVDLWGLECSASDKNATVNAYTIERPNVVNLYASVNLGLLKNLYTSHIITNATTNLNAKISGIYEVKDPSPITEYLESDNVVHVKMDYQTETVNVSSLYLDNGKWEVKTYE